MTSTQSSTGKSAAWGVVACILGSGTFGTWIAAATTGTGFPVWPTWALCASTAAAVCMCFAPFHRWRPGSRRCPRDAPPVPPRSRLLDDVSLFSEPVGDHLRLLIRNDGRPAELSAQVIAIHDQLGRPVYPQHWTIPWLDDSSTEPKRVLRGQCRILDFARFEAVAVRKEIQNGQGKDFHWRFSAVPAPIGARYYNLRSDADLDQQCFHVTLRLLNATTQDYVDCTLEVGVEQHGLTCAIRLAPREHR